MYTIKLTSEQNLVLLGAVIGKKLRYEEFASEHKSRMEEHPVESERYEQEKSFYDYANNEIERLNDLLKAVDNYEFTPEDE